MLTVVLAIIITFLLGCGMPFAMDALIHGIKVKNYGSIAIPILYIVLVVLVLGLIIILSA